MRAINLLPPEEAQRSAARRRRAGLIFLLLLYVGALAVGYLFFQGRAEEAEQRLEDQIALNDQIRAEITRLAPAAELRLDYQTRAANVADILAADVAWGRFLNDLARVIPDRVWLSAFTASASLQPDLPGSFGQVTMAGVAFDYPDAASWLRTLDSDRWPAVGAAWVLSTTSETIVEDVDAVNFSSVGTLTQAALGNRIDERIPEVPE
jgi:Tfp pilus assembly protein PilN